MWHQKLVWGPCPWQSFLVLLNEGLWEGWAGGPGTWYSWNLGTMAESTVFLQDAPWPGTSQGGAVKVPTPPGTLFPKCLPTSPAFRNDAVSIVPVP